ncbi:MAG: hypothetical protein ABFS37_09655 [Acidobacteriota bacterium]
MQLLRQVQMAATAAVTSLGDRERAKSTDAGPEGGSLLPTRIAVAGLLSLKRFTDAVSVCCPCPGP